MKFTALLSALAVSVSGKTAGCGQSKPKNGKQTFQNQNHNREFWLHVPSGYDKDTPTPVVVLFHGWGYSGKEWYSGGGWGAVSAAPAADKHNFILVAPTGLDDSKLGGNCDNGGGYCSWNGGGTTGSPGPEGPTCNYDKQKDDLCYRDTCPDGCKDICSWTTCNDDTTMVHALVDKIEDELCVDTSRLYVGGESNGGVMTWQMGTDSRAARFAAFVATIGLPHHGFNFLPSIVPMPIMGIWGSSDRTIPHGNNNAEYTESQDGWYYTTARTITKDWSAAHGCNTKSSPSKYATSFDGDSGLACTAYSEECSTGTAAPVVDCRFTGGHVVKSFVPELMWEFFSLHTRQLEHAQLAYNRSAWGGVTNSSTALH